MLGISTQSFNSKPDGKTLLKVSFTQQDLSISEIVEFIRRGHIFTSVFKNTPQEYHIWHKRDENFDFSQCIALDFDGDIDAPLNCLVDSLSAPPTIAFTTFSHQKVGKGNRYRLIYLFDEPITTADEYHHIYDAICKENGISLTDNCGRSVSQMFYGSNEECEIIRTDEIYSSEYFAHIPMSEVIQETSERKERKHHFSQDSVSPNSTSHDSHFLEDFRHLPLNEILQKYFDIFPFFECTILPPTDVDSPVIKLPEDFISIKRRILKRFTYEPNGEMKCYISVRRIKNGERRRRKLFLNALLRRKMRENISFDHLLYCLIYELYHYYDNSDKSDLITKKDLYNICNNAMHVDLTKYADFFYNGRDGRKMMANPDYCNKYHVSKRSAINEGRRKLSDDIFLKYYDKDKTIADNVKILEEHGIKISLRTFKNVMKRNGITKNNKKKD